MTEQKPSPKILIVGPSWVGDMVMAQSLCAALQQRYQDPVIDILAPAWSAPIIARMPGVNEAIVHSFQHGQFMLKERRQLGKKLKQRQYDQAIVIPGSWKSALVPWFAKIPVRTGYVGEQRYGLLNDIRRLKKTEHPKMIQRLLLLAQAKNDFTEHAIINPELQTQDVTASMHRYDMANKGGQQILALCPGAEFGESKRWPEEHYAHIAREKLDQGWQVWLFGSQNDFPVAEAINQICQGRCKNLAGKTNLGEAVDLLSLADLVICNDSGLMHVACALGRCVISVFGSSSASFTPPLSAKAQVVSLDLDCQPCFKRTCPKGHFNCMKQLKPEMVMDAEAKFGSSADQ